MNAPPEAGDGARRRRNLAIMLVVLGLVAMAAAGLGLILVQSTEGQRADYRGVEELESEEAPDVPQPVDVPPAVMR